MKILKKILKWTAIAAGALIAILLILNVVFVMRSDSRLERQFAAVRAAGDPLALAELAGEPIPPEENAATYLRRARHDVDAIQDELSEVLQSETYEKGSPTEEERKTIQSAFEAYPEVLGLLRQAAACDRYVPNLDYTLAPPAFNAALLPHVQDHRSVARVLRARALAQLAEGNQDEAVETCILFFRLSRHFERGPTMVGYLVSLACHSMAADAANQVLRAGPVSDEAREALETELAQHSGFEGIQWALKSERVLGLESYRTLPNRNNWFLRAMWNRDESFYLDMIDDQLSLASRPYSEHRAADAAQVAKLAQSRTPLAALVYPALRATREATERTRAILRCLRVLNALQSHAQPEDSSVPELADLGLPAGVTTDPFNGKPLIVKRLPEGWLIYSVGKNLQDDGGKLDDASDVGVGPKL